MKSFKLHVVVAFILIALFSSQAFADEMSTKEATTSALNPDTPSANEMLTFHGSLNLRLYSKYYENAEHPWAVYSKMCATLGMTADLGPVFMGFTLATSNIDQDDPTYGDASDNLTEFNFMNDFSTVFKEAYAIWRANELFYMTFGRSPWTIDKGKKMYVYRTGLTFDGGRRLDTIGGFPVLYNQNDTVMTMAIVMSYLGRYLDPLVTVDNPGYRHFWLLGVQPKVEMALPMMNAIFGGGLWTVTHPSDLQAAGGASQPWGKDVFGNDKNANLFMLELFGKLNIDQTNVFAHIMLNMGTEEQGVGALIGFTHGATKKTGDVKIGATLYYIENYAWLDTMPDTTLGVGYKGVQVSVDWMFYQNMVFYALCTFKNQIADGDSTTGQIYLKTGIKINFSLKPKK